jgi:hypothetical protein
MDNGGYHWTYLDSVTDGDTFVIHTAVPAGRTLDVNAPVYTMRYAAMANLS